MIQVLKDSLSFFKFNFFIIFKIYLPIFIIDLSISIILGLLPDSQLVNFIGFIVGLIIGSTYFSALIFLFNDLLNGNSISSKECLFKGFIMVPLVLYTDCLSLLITIVGLIFFIIPGLILSAKLSLQSFFLLLSENKPVEAIKNSYSVTKGYTKNIVGCFVLVGIPYIIIFKILPSIFKNKFEFLFLLFPLEIFSDLFSTFFVIILFRFYCLIHQNESEA